MQIRQRIFKWFAVQVGPFCLQHSKTFDVSHAFLRVTIAELSTLKQVQFFLAHPVDYIQGAAKK